MEFMNVSKKTFFWKDKLVKKTKAGVERKNLPINIQNLVHICKKKVL